MKYRRSVIRQWTPILWIASALLLSACSLPRIIVLHDPLTAEEHDNLGRTTATKTTDAPPACVRRISVPTPPTSIPRS